MKTYWGSGGIAPRILNLGTRWRWVISLMILSLYPQGDNPQNPLDRRLGGPQWWSGQGGEEKNSVPLPFQPTYFVRGLQRYLKLTVNQTQGHINNLNFARGGRLTEPWSNTNLLWFKEHLCCNLALTTQNLHLFRYVKKSLLSSQRFWRWEEVKHPPPPLGTFFTVLTKLN